MREYEMDEFANAQIYHVLLEQALPGENEITADDKRRCV